MSVGIGQVRCSFTSALARPEIQAIAEEELDVAKRRERLPKFEDRPRFPFVDATCKEVVRWRLIAPLGELLPSIHLIRSPCPFTCSIFSRDKMAEELIASNDQAR